MRHVVLVWMCWIGVVGVVPPAFAYQQTLSPEGKPLFWKGNNIRFEINQRVPNGLSADSVYHAIRQSFLTWSSQSCTCLRFEDGGLTPDTAVGYDQSNPQADKNLIVFQSNTWPHPGQAVALTSNVFKQDTGEIIAYDMEINDVDFRFSLDGQPRNGQSTMDLQNVVTHEVGHVLGLDHSNIRRSTMFASGQPGETHKRDLHSDDVSGLCALYPTDGCTGVSTQPKKLQPQGCGCTQTTTTRSPWLPLFLLSLLLLLFARPLFRTRS